MNPTTSEVKNTRDALNLSSPSASPSVKTVTKWFSHDPDSSHDQSSQGPAKSVDDLGMVPEGHIVTGFTEDHERIVRGIVMEGDLEWTYVAKNERLDAANHFLETLDFPEGLSYIPMTMEQRTTGSGYYEWQFDGVEDQRFQDILVLKDGDKTPVEMSVFLRFAEFSTEIVCAELDGVDITPKNVQGDVEVPGVDNNSPDENSNSPGEDCGPEPC